MNRPRERSKPINRVLTLWWHYSPGDRFIRCVIRMGYEWVSERRIDFDNADDAEMFFESHEM